MRRSNHDMQLMKIDVTSYLLQTRLDPHKAHEKMIKEHLESGESIPYYIKGVKDFITVSQELAVKLNKEELMAKKDKKAHQDKMNIIEYIIGLSTAELKVIYREYKEKLPKHEYLELHNLYLIKMMNEELTKKDINEVLIGIFRRIGMRESA